MSTRDELRQLLAGASVPEPPKPRKESLMTPDDPLPPPRECDTAEEVREYYRDIERELYRVEMDRPQEGEEW